MRAACAYGLVVFRGLSPRRLLFVVGLGAGVLLLTWLSTGSRDEDWWMFCRLACWLGLAGGWLGGLVLAGTALPGELEERRALALVGGGLSRASLLLGTFLGVALYVLCLLAALWLAVCAILLLPSELPALTRDFAAPRAGSVSVLRDGRRTPVERTFLGAEQPPARLCFQFGPAPEGFLLIAPRVLHEGGGRRGGRLTVVRGADSLELELGAARPVRLPLPAQADSFEVALIPGPSTLLGVDQRRGLYGDPVSGVFVAAARTPAALQFLRGFALIFLGALPLIALGVAASTRLSGWVAVMFLLCFLVVGNFSGFIREVTEVPAAPAPGTPGRLVLPDFPERSPAAEVAESLARQTLRPEVWGELYLRRALLAGLRLLPDFAAYDPEPAFRAGRILPDAELRARGGFALLFCAGSLALGWLGLRRRNLG